VWQYWGRLPIFEVQEEKGCQTIEIASPIKDWLAMMEKQKNKAQK